MQAIYLVGPKMTLLIIEYNRKNLLLLEIEALQ